MALRLEPAPVRCLAISREGRSKGALRGLVVSGDRPGLGEADGCLQRSASPFGCGQRGLGIAGRRECPRLGQAQLLVQPGRNGPPGPSPGDDLHGHRGASLGQCAARGDQVGRRAGQLVRADAESGVSLLDAATCLTQLPPLKVRPGQRDQRCGAGTGRLVLASQRNRLAGEFRGAANPAAPRLRQRQLPGEIGSFTIPAGSGRDGHPRLEDADRFAQTTRPQFDGGAASQHLPPDLRMPGQFSVWDLTEHQLRTADGRCGRRQLPGAQADGEPDHRGRQPGRGLLVNVKAFQQAIGGIQGGGTRAMLAGGKRQRRRNQVGLRPGPGFAGWHAGELAGQALVVPWLDELVEGQVLNDHACAQRPVAGRSGVPYRVGKHAVPLVPPGGAPVQRGYSVRMLVSQPQPERLGEQRVVAVPPGADRPDQRVGARQGRQDAGGLIIPGQLDGGRGADMLQDARVQQDLTHFRRLDIEYLVDQVTGQSAALGDQFLDEQVRIGVSAQRYRGQAQAGRPAFGAPVQALQRVRGEQAGVLAQQQAGLIEAEGEVTGPDLGQLPG